MLSHHDSMPLPSPSNQPVAAVFARKPTGFFARLTSAASSPDNQSQVEQAVRWLVSSDAHFKHWAQILELADKLAGSEAESKLAVRALKKEIKHAAPDVQARAVRLTVVLALNSSDRFRLQIASKKFLDTVQDTFTKAGKHSTTSSTTHPNGNQNGYLLIRDMILKAFAVLGFEFQHDADLYVFTNFYNRIKPVDAPLNGTALSDTDGLFAPSLSTPSQPSAAPAQTAAASPFPPQPVQHQPFHAQQPPSRYPHPLPHQPVALPEMRDVRAEAEIARSNARLLLEALAFTVPSEMEDNEIIQEFHTKCLQNQNQLLDDIPWATAQAERARAHLQRHAPSQQQASNRLSRTTPSGPEAGEGTREEHLLAMLLAANSELVDAFRQFDELERLARSEREMRAVEERSRHDTRIARDAHGLLDVDAPPHSRPSGSRSPGLRASGDEQRPFSGGSNEYHFGAVDAGQPDEQPVEGYRVSSEGEVEWPVGGHLTAEPVPIEGLRSDQVQAEIGSPGRLADDDGGSPVGPSAKALGKMRRISGRSDESPGIGGSGGGHQTEGSKGPGSVLKEEEEEWEVEKRRKDVDERERAERLF